MTSIIIPNSVTGELGDYTFKGCTLLAKVTIGDGVESIESETFRDCEALEEISFGTGLKRIARDTFSGCTFLSKITCHSATPPAASLSTFYRYTYDHADLYVPQESLSDYKNDNVWKRFLNLHGDDPTGIEGIDAEGAAEDEQRIYDLQGRKLKMPVRGLNIINGKKVVVK